MPGWYGLGSGLDAIIAEIGIERVRDLYRESPFFRALINNAELALSRADIEVAEMYAKLADADAQKVFPLIRAEWDRTVAGVLAVIDKQQILGNRPHILATVKRRNPYVDVLSHVQVELRKRMAAGELEADRDRVLSVLFTTINGIAAGLQTAG